MFVFSELVGWWAGGLVRQWEWGLGAGDSGMGVVSGTVGQWDSGTVREWGLGIGDWGLGTPSCRPVFTGIPSLAILTEILRLRSG